MAKNPSAGDQKTRLLHIIESFDRVSVAVLGDMVADEFVYGEIMRVSREAPVLILKYRERTTLPGSAANAVINLASLGVNVLPVGVVGDDEPGRLVLKAFRQKHVPTSGILKVRGYNTVTKTRILAGTAHSSRQQVVRIDREPDSLPDAHAERAIIQAVREYARASDALLISDYGYGTVTPDMLDSIRARGAFHNVPVMLDSRYRMLDYAGINAATPNQMEVESALGIKIGDDSELLLQAGKTLLHKMKLQSLLITRGRHGLAAFSRGAAPVEVPVHGSDQATDVTGAGDTVIATFTAALATGATTESAARLANYAGGIVVMKSGTATVTQQELTDAVNAG